MLKVTLSGRGFYAGKRGTELSAVQGESDSNKKHSKRAAIWLIVPI